VKFVGRIVTLIFCTLFVHRAYSDSALEHIQKMEQLQATELSKMVARVHQKLSELMLYDDTYQDAAEAQRASVVAKAERSAAAITKQTTGQTEDGRPVHSFPTLIGRSRHADPKHPGDRHRPRALLYPVGSAHADYLFSKISDFYDHKSRKFRLGRDFLLIGDFDSSFLRKYHLTENIHGHSLS
jgi:hypothetical protein